MSACLPGHPLRHVCPTRPCWENVSKPSGSGGFLNGMRDKRLRDVGADNVKRPSSPAILVLDTCDAVVWNRPYFLRRQPPGRAPRRLAFFHGTVRYAPCPGLQRPCLFGEQVHGRSAAWRIAEQQPSATIDTPVEVAGTADCPALFSGTFHRQPTAATLKRTPRRVPGMMRKASSRMVLPGRRARPGTCVIEDQSHSMRTRISLSSPTGTVGAGAFVASPSARC